MPSPYMKWDFNYDIDLWSRPFGDSDGPGGWQYDPTIDASASGGSGAYSNDRYSSYSIWPNNGLQSGRGGSYEQSRWKWSSLRLFRWGGRDYGQQPDLEQDYNPNYLKDSHVFGPSTSSNNAIVVQNFGSPGDENVFWPNSGNIFSWWLGIQFLTNSSTGGERRGIFVIPGKVAIWVEDGYVYCRLTGESTPAFGSPGYPLTGGSPVSLISRISLNDLYDRNRIHNKYITMYVTGWGAFYEFLDSVPYPGSSGGQMITLVVEYSTNEGASWGTTHPFNLRRNPGGISTAPAYIGNGLGELGIQGLNGEIGRVVLWGNPYVSSGFSASPFYKSILIQMDDGLLPSETEYSRETAYGIVNYSIGSEVENNGFDWETGYIRKNEPFRKWSVNNGIARVLTKELRRDYQGSLLFWHKPSGLSQPLPSPTNELSTEIGYSGFAMPSTSNFEANSIRNDYYLTQPIIQGIFGIELDVYQKNLDGSAYVDSSFDIQGNKYFNYETGQQYGFIYLRYLNHDIPFVIPPNSFNGEWYYGYPEIEPGLPEYQTSLWRVLDQNELAILSNPFIFYLEIADGFLNLRLNNPSSDETLFSWTPTITQTTSPHQSGAGAEGQLFRPDKIYQWEPRHIKNVLSSNRTLINNEWWDEHYAPGLFYYRHYDNKMGWKVGYI